MRDNVPRGWTLLELAQAVNLSVWRLAHIFVSEVGKSPIHYLRELRMDRARYLLEASFLSVKEIAHQVGIKDESHFIRDFKKVYGEPPTRYRLRSMSGQLNEVSSENKSDLENGADEGAKKNERRKAINNQLAKAAKRSILIFLNFVTYLMADLDKAI
ncbi:MAG TPA: helix-turn-helix transcriptional regulator [Pyrinomonadaceae bacterium]|nr:helix-turn-helix transcriptional regulator [Pyrinomonadaceae bacterium]